MTATGARKARLDGAEAYRAGESLAALPEALRASPERFLWLAGWHAAHRVAEYHRLAEYNRCKKETR